MGAAACGCISKESETEITAIPNEFSLDKKFPFGDLTSECTSGHIAVPVVDMEKEFAKLLEGLVIQNSIVNVFYLSHRNHRPNDSVSVLLPFTSRPTSRFSTSSLTTHQSAGRRTAASGIHVAPIRIGT